ncbi:EndoU domain-containing protein [Kitasatospora sp. NPDC015120]|uniref:EndoU domain-containing protein n=1 Tax=Kitasatospora sp. NPDC015120 TaxID=3364023 RepID=UPI0036F4ADC4
MAHSSIEVNESTARFFTIITGMPWPEIREGDLREVRDAYEQLAKEMPALRALIEKVAVSCARQFKGQAATSFAYQMNAFIGRTGGDDYVSAAGKTAKALADCAGDVANAVEYTKWMAIAQLVQLLVEIALAVFWAPFSFGTSLSGLVLKKLLTKAALTALMKYLLKTIAMHTFSGIVGGLLMDGIIQNLQIGQGNRKEIDKEYTKQAVLFGVIGGVLGGPLDLLGLGLGKLLGRLLGKSGGRLLADKLSDYLVDGELKSLKGTLKTAAEAAAASGEKGALGTIGKETSKGLADEALKKAQARAFARDLGSLMEASAEQLRAGFGKTTKGSLGDTFVKEMEKTFVKHLGEQLGKKEAAALGRELGEKFAEKWVGKARQTVPLRGAASEGLAEALDTVLKQDAGKGLTAHQVSALGKHLPDLADGLSQGNKMFQLGLGLGNYLQSGAQNVLSEGFYNLIFGENHEFTVTAGSFVGGMMTAMMGHVMHLGSAPLMHGYADLVQRTQFKAVEQGASKYFPLYHPISFAAIASMASGKIVPFPVPRMGHPEAFEFARGQRITSLDDVVKGLSHASGVDITTPPADHEVAEWMQQLLPYVDLLADERARDLAELKESLTRTVGHGTEDLPTVHEERAGPVKVQSDDAPSVAPGPPSREAEQRTQGPKAPEQKAAEHKAPDQRGTPDQKAAEAPKRSTPGRTGAVPPVSTESSGDVPTAPRRRPAGTTDDTTAERTATTAERTATATSSARVPTASTDHPAPNRTPRDLPAGTDESGRHPVQEPAPPAPRRTTSPASALFGQDTPPSRAADDAGSPAPPRTLVGEETAPAPGERAEPRPKAPQAQPDAEVPVPPPATDTTTDATDTAAATPAAPAAQDAPAPPLRPGPDNPWHPTEPDGTLRGAPRRPPAPASGQWQEVLPNGTVRVHRTELDAAVRPGAPASAFPSRWSRSVLDPGAVYYPKDWTAAQLRHHVTTALADPVLQREANGLHYRLGRSGGVWIEGMYLPDGSLLGHRPAPYQSIQNPRYDAPGTLTASRGEEVRPPGLGPVRVRRDLMHDGAESLEVTARVKLVGGEHMTQQELLRARARLERAAAEFTAGPGEGRPRARLRLEFTQDGDAVEVRLAPGQDPTLRQAVPRLHERAAADGPAATLAALRRQAPPPPETVSGATRMLAGRQALFEPSAWDNPTRGRHLPREWTADEARYAASVVAGSAHRVPAGPVPPGGTTAPELRHGTFAGVKLTVRVENGLITDFWGRPDQRMPDQLAAPRPEQHQVLGTHRVRPPRDALERTMDERVLQRFLVSRIRLADGDTESLVTVRVHLDTSALDLKDQATAKSLKELVKRTRTGVSEAYDIGQRLPSGDRLRVRVEFVADRAKAHHTVQVHAQQDRADHRTWGLNTSAVVAAHEVGHMLGLADEYRERSDGAKPRPVYLDGGLLGSYIRDGFDRPVVDMDNVPGGPVTTHPRPVLRARNLRQLGAVIDQVFGADRGPGPESTHPPRPRMNPDALRLALHGSLHRDSLRLPGGGRDGGGHLFPPPGSGDPRPTRIPGSENRNGTFRVLGGPADGVGAGQHRLAGELDVSAAVRARGRTMFPEHWSADDAAYAAEQAYQHARRRGDAAFTRSGPDSWTWTGEYGGVRIDGRIQVRTEQGPRGPVQVAEIVAFRPSDDQGGLGPAPHLPWHPQPDTFDQRAADLLRYGDRQTLTGVHHQPPSLSGAVGSASPEGQLAGQRMGVKIGTHSPVLPNGTYRATVWYLDPAVNPAAPMAAFDSRWFKRADHPLNTFYPEHWRPARVLRAVDAAYAARDRAGDRVVDGAVHWTGIGDGVRIEGITRDGRHVVHRPADEQPGVVRRAGAPRSAPLTEPGPPGTGRRPAVVSGMPPGTVPDDVFSPHLSADAGRGLPAQWTAQEQRFAVHKGRRLGEDTALDGGGTRGTVVFAGVEITVLRDADGKVTDFSVADGHTPPAQLDVPVPERGTRRPKAPAGEEHEERPRRAPHDPGSEDGSDTSSRRGEDEDSERGSEDGSAYDSDEDFEYDSNEDFEEADDAMSEASRADTLDLISDDEPMEWDGTFDDAHPATGPMDLDQSVPQPPRRVRPAHEAPAPDLRFAELRDPVEVRPPADPARHLSDSTLLRRFQVARGVLVDGRPAVELVVRIHLDAAGLPHTPDRDRAVQELRDRARRGIDHYYNTGHRLPNGDVLVTRVEFVDADRAHHRVEVLEGTGREAQDEWHLDSTERTLAHEFGHLLGLPDEYRERRVRAEGTDENGDTVVIDDPTHPRPVTADASLMGSATRTRGRVRFDQDAGLLSDGTVVPDALAPRHLRELGRAIEDALGPGPGAPVVDGLPRRASFGRDALQTSTFGDTRNPGGHLLPPAGSDRTGPGRVLRVERNGVVVADFSGEGASTLPRPRRLDGVSAAADDLIVPGSGRRRMFPRNWTSEDAVYAAEQAYLHALGTNDIVHLGGSRHRWTGEYAGVRIEGEIRAGEFLSFRPSDRQPDVDPPRYAPHRPGLDGVFGAFGQRAEDVARYGDRGHLTGLHHELDLPPAEAQSALRAHGARIVETSPPIHNGTYRARAAFLDPTVAPTSPLADFPTRWRLRSSGSGRTMYPRTWTADGLTVAVDAAHDSVPVERRVYGADGRTYHWAGEAYGVRIEGLSRDGLHLAHRPSEIQPLAEWQPRREVGSSPDTRVWLGTQPLSVARVLFDSGQEGLRITVPVRTVVAGPLPAHLPLLARAEMQHRVDTYVRERMLEAAGPGGQPPLVTVRLDFDPPHGEVFSTMLLRPDGLSDAETLLGPLALSGPHRVFAWQARELGTLATPAEQLLAVHGGPRVPTDLREPGPLREGEQPPAVVPGWDQQTVRYLATMDVRFSERALAADPRDLPADRSLPHEWNALDSRWAALRVLEDHERRHGSTVSGIVRGTLGDVVVEVHVEDGQIVRVTGVGDQRGLPQLHVPPFVPEPGAGPHHTSQEPPGPAAADAPLVRDAVRPDADPAGAAMVRALVEDDPGLLRRLFGDEEAGRLAADPAAAERALHELVEARFRENPELGREAHELYTAWARWTGNEPADWPVFAEDLQRELAAWREKGWAGVHDPRTVRDAFAVLTAAALDLRVSLVEVRNEHATVAEFGPAGGRPVRLDHDEREGYSTVAAAERRQEHERLLRETAEERRGAEEAAEARRRAEEERRADEETEARSTAGEEEVVRRRPSGEDEDSEEEVRRPSGEDEDSEEEVVRRPSEEDEDSEDEPRTPAQLEEARRRAAEIREGKRVARDGGEDSGLPGGNEDSGSPGGNETPVIVPAPVHAADTDTVLGAGVGAGTVVDPGPRPPKSVLDRGVLSGAHMVTSLGEPDTVLVGKLGAKIEQALPAGTPNRASFARALAESVFSGTSLRALVSALSRGDVLHIPVGTDAHQGTITLRGEVAGLVHHSQKAKFEYEGGGDRVVTLGGAKGASRSFGVGIQGRGDVFKVMRAALDAFGVNRDRARADELTTSSKFFSRAKTTEVTELFRGKLLVDVGYRPKGERETESLPPRLDPDDARLLTTPLEIGVPQRETRPPAESDIRANLLGELDPALLAQKRLHSSTIMLDVHVKGEPQVRPAARQTAGGSTELGNLGPLRTDPLPTHRQAMVGVVEALRRSVLDEKEAHERTVRERTPEDDAALDAAARRERAGREKAAAERIARAEEALAFHGSTLSDRLVAEFGFRRLQQDFKGLTNGESVIVRVPGSDVWAEVRAGSLGMRLVATTKDTEFNTGAGSVVTRLRRKVVAGFLQLQGGGRIGTDEVNVTAGFGKRWGRDKVVVTGRTLETAVTTKTKENGAVLDGDGYLEVVVHRGDERLGDPVQVPLGFRTLMPQSDLLVNEVTAAPEPGRRRLPESAVIRDIGPLGEVRQALEEAGKRRYGSLWPQIRTEVMQIVTQPSLASKLGAMSRGDAFELTAFDRDKATGALAALAQRGVKVTVRAELVDTQLVRRSKAADLSRQNESSSFTTEQRYTSRFDIKQGAVGYAPVREMPSGQVQLSQEIRVRGGVRSDANDKLYANSKMREEQDVHRGTMRLTVVLEGGLHDTPPVTGDISAEYSVKARTGAATGTPAVLPRNELGAASVVAFRNEEGTPGGDRLYQDVRAALKDRFQWRGGISDSLERTLRAELGANAMQAKLSQLTRGGVLKVPVAGPGWSAEVVVRAALREEPVVKYTINGAEFEVGTQNRTGHGVMRDIRDRVTGLLGLTGRARKEQDGGPGVTLTGDYSYRQETATGGNLQSSGTAVNRAKNVSTAVVSDAVVDYRVEIHGWTGGLIPSTTKLGPITMEAEVVTPQYDAPTATTLRTVPDRIWQDHVLGSSDVVTNVFVPGTRNAGEAAADFGKAVLRGNGDPGEFGGRNVEKWLHGPGRSGLRHKLYDALAPDHLHDQLKAMMAGRELVVADGGVTVRIGASVKRLAHTGNTTTTEFNTGTQVEHGHSAADGATGGGTGSGRQVRGGVAVSTGLFYAGDTVAVSTGNSTRETWSNRTGSGNTTKVKPVGNVFTGEASLHFSVEWRDLVSTEGRHVLVTKRAYFRRELGMDVVIDVAETRENVPGNPPGNPGKVFDAATAPRGADLRRGLTDDLPVVEDTAAPGAQVPPARVWTHGLTDTDVVRAVGMTPHARQQLTEGAEAFLGSGDWDRIRGMVEGMIDPVALASRLVTPHTPYDAAAPHDAAAPVPEGGAAPPRPDEPALKDGPGNSTLVVGRTDLAGDVRVEVRMKVRELEFVKTDSRTESNPTNTTSVTDGVRAQRAIRVANRLTAGGVSPDTFVAGLATLRGGLYVDNAYEHRTDIELVEGGQIVNNAKIATTTARYRGFVEVEVVYHKDGRTLPRRELMAVEIDIPVGDTTRAEVPHNAFLRFDEQTQNGELRLHGAPKDALPTVARALGLDVGEADHHARLLRVGHIARKLLPESLTVSGERGERWLRGLDRMIDLASDGAAGTPFERLREAAGRQSVPPVERRRLQDLVELAGADDTLTAGDLNAHWEVLTQRQSEQERLRQRQPGVQQQEGEGDPPQPPQPPREPQPDLSLHRPTVPDVRLRVVAGDATSVSALLREVRTTVLQADALRARAPRAEGDDRPPLVEITLDVPAGRALREARALEQRLRGLARGLAHEVDMVIVAGTTTVPQAGGAAPGRATGAVHSFRLGSRPPGTEATTTTVRREPVDGGVVRDLERDAQRDLAVDEVVEEDGHRGSPVDEVVEEDGRQDPPVDEVVEEDGRQDPPVDEVVEEDGHRGSPVDEVVEEDGRRDPPVNEVVEEGEREGSVVNEDLGAGVVPPDLLEDGAGRLDRATPEHPGQSQHPGQLPPVPPGRRADHVSDGSSSSRSSRRSSSSSEDLPDEQAGPGGSTVTAPRRPAGAPPFYRHPGERLGDEPDHVSVDSDLPDLPDLSDPLHGRDASGTSWHTARLYEGAEDLSDPPHGRDVSGTSWRTARLYEGEEEFYRHPGMRLGDDSDNVSVDSDLTDSRSERSEDSWVEVQAPPAATPRPPSRVPQHAPLEPLDSLEDSIFATLTQADGNGGQRV